MPRPLRFGGLSRPKTINIKLPGLRASGSDPDRLRISAETKDKTTYHKRAAMVRELYARGMVELLRARAEGLFSTAELHLAYLGGPEALEKLRRRATTPALFPLVKHYLDASRSRDKAKLAMQLNRFVDFLGSGGRSETTIRSPSDRVAMELAWRTKASISDLSTGSCEAFLGGLSSNRGTSKRANSGATKNRYRAAISGFATYLVSRGVLTDHPIAFKRVRKFAEADPRLPSLTSEERDQYLISAAERRPDLVVLLYLLLHTGADVSEVLSRRVSHIASDSNGRLTIRYKRAKTRTAERTVPVPEPARQALLDHITEHQLANDAEIFGMVKRAELESLHRYASKSIGRSAIRLKDLRHFAAQSWRSVGIGIQTIKEWLGHATIAQTTIYMAYDGPSHNDVLAAERAAKFNRGTAGRVLAFKRRLA